jgi:hypothetical protein
VMLKSETESVTLDGVVEVAFAQVLFCQVLT